MRENQRLIQKHDAMVDFISGRMTGCNLGLLDALSSLDNYPTEFVEYVDWSDDDDEYPRQNNRYCGFAPHFLNSGFPKPLPGLPCFKTTKRITPEEAAKNAKELIDEEEKLKKKSEKKKQKKMRQRERRQREKLEKENADKTGNKQVNPTPVKSKPAERECENEIKSNNSTVVSSDSNDEDEDDQENVADEREELDLNSCFVTNAAAIAKRKLKQKPTFERKDKKAENAKQQTGQQKSAVQPHNKKEVEEDGSEEAGNDFVTKSMELAVMGNAYADSGNFNMAVKYFTEAIKHNPKEHKFFGNRSFCYERMQQYEKALTDAVVAVQLNSTFIKGLFRKGKALVGLKRYNEACLTYKEILKLNSSCTEAAQELMLAQIMWLMDMGFSREQSSNALIIHGTVEKALEALSGMEGSIAAAPMHCEEHDEEEWVKLEKNPQSHKVPLRAVPQNQPRSSSVVMPSSLGLFPVWVGNLVPGITNSMITELFRRIGPVCHVKVLSEKHCAFVNYTNKEDSAKAIRDMHGYTFAGTCLVVRYPDRIHPHLGVSTTASTNTGKVSKLPEECQFWRTAGCIKNNRCSYRHVPEHKGIDQPKAK
ncbi:hypothetical protein P4O66_002134 [Electrophorus voltai]|uniref:C3H1-type domain-containing protein n=1 Tax=Electrophorus voltai TaxID=2609070 RepID=A0AAD8Z423_9TELE|nr:hypothetical protein P4O66_002134 [Electrophorus voltai]